MNAPRRGRSFVHRSITALLVILIPLATACTSHSATQDQLSQLRATVRASAMNDACDQVRRG